MLFVIAATVYFIVGLFIIFSTNGAIRSDQGDAYHAAVQINQGVLISLETGHEMFTFTHNLGIMSLFRLLTSIYESTRTIYCFNLMMIIAANYFLFKTADVVFNKNKLVNKYAILFSFFFVPQLFYTLYAYGNVPGFAGICAMMYFCAQFIKGVKFDINAVMAVLFASYSVVMKSNYIIGIIAAIILISLEFIRKPSKAKAMVAFLLIMSTILPQNLIVNYYENLAGHQLTGDAKFSYIAMGLQEGKQGPGWYNSYNINTLRQFDYNVDAANAAAVENIKERADYFRENPEYTYTFFSQKIMSTWCEPTFQSIKSGPSNENNRYTKSDILKNLYNGEAVYDMMYNYCNVFTVNILIFTALYVLYSLAKENENIFDCFPSLFLTGGFIFHLLWETKSRYVYMYIACLSPAAAMGVNVILTLTGNMISKRKAQNKRSTLRIK